jgi:hypothetical protein
MVCTWSPDTCLCKIVYDSKTFTVDPIKSKPCKIHTEFQGQDLLNYVIVENQTSNEFYSKWAEKDFENPDAMLLIKEYKKVFVELPNFKPIRSLSFKDSKSVLRG